MELGFDCLDFGYFSDGKEFHSIPPNEEKKIWGFGWNAFSQVSFHLFLFSKSKQSI